MLRILHSLCLLVYEILTWLMPTLCALSIITVSTPLVRLLCELSNLAARGVARSLRHQYARPLRFTLIFVMNACVIVLYIIIKSITATCSAVRRTPTLVVRLLASARAMACDCTKQGWASNVSLLLARVC